MGSGEKLMSPPHVMHMPGKQFFSSSLSFSFTPRLSGSRRKEDVTTDYYSLNKVSETRTGLQSKSIRDAKVFNFSLLTSRRRGRYSSITHADPF